MERTLLFYYKYHKYGKRDLIQYKNIISETAKPIVIAQLLPVSSQISAAIGAVVFRIPAGVHAVRNACAQQAATVTINITK